MTNPAAPAPDLLPCPFCGSERTSIGEGEHNIDNEIHPIYFGECTACGTMGPDYNTPELARLAWQMRQGEAKAAPPAVSPRDLSLMDEAIRRCAIEFEGARFSAAWTRIKSTLVPPVAENTSKETK